MLTIFGNLWIDNKTKLQHLKDSFESFAGISDDWIINVRGKYRKQAISFLISKLGKKLELFELLDETVGWSTNALVMLEKAKYEYVLIWNEDHINLAPQKIYKTILTEMSKEKVDAMWYSWWLFGQSRANYEVLPLKKLKSIDTVKLSIKRWLKVNKPGNKFYIITFMSILKKEFFKSLLQEDQKMFPFKFTKKLRSFIAFLKDKGVRVVIEEIFPVINRLSGFKFRKFPEYTPFNLEREQYRTDILPIKIALSKRELFACIEDDLQEPGYSLVSRGIYKKGSEVKNRG